MDGEGRAWTGKAGHGAPVALALNASLVGGLSVARMQAVEHVAPKHTLNLRSAKHGDLCQGRKAHAVQATIVNEVDEQLGCASVRPFGVTIFKYNNALPAVANVNVPFLLV